MNDRKKPTFIERTSFSHQLAQDNVSESVEQMAQAHERLKRARRGKSGSTVPNHATPEKNKGA